MGCHAVPAKTELEFIQAIRDRNVHDQHCAGPIVRISFSAYRLSSIETAFDSEVAHDLLWSGFHPENLDAVDFSLCAVHWMDLACLILIRAKQHGVPQWFGEAEALLDALFRKTGWDRKEISNLLTWQRARLT